MIKAILFDFGQTLVDSADGFRAAEKEVQGKIYADLGLTSRQDFLTNYRKIRAQFHARGRLSRIAIWQEVYWYFCREADRQLLEKWEVEYWEKIKARTAVFPETQTTLEHLASEYKLALVTNTQGQKITDQHRLSLFPQLEKFFEVVIIAGESDLPCKPDPAPFRLCLAEMKVTPAQAVYIGDDWRNDICGANNAGIQPIWIKHKLVRRSWPKVKESIPIITSLGQLLNLDKVLRSY